MPLSSIPAKSVQFPLEGGYYHTPTVLTDAASVQPDLTLNNVFSWTITQDATLAFPASIPGAGIWHIYLTQDVVGDHVLSLASGYNFIEGTIEPSAGAESIITIVSDGSGTDLDVFYYEQTATATRAYDVVNSCKFNDDATAYFSKSQTTSNQNKMTWSGWVKPAAKTGAISMLHASDASPSVYHSIDLRNFVDDTSVFSTVGTDTSGANIWVYKTIAKHRDPSAWYHLVVAIDTTQKLAADRVKMYVNGERMLDFSPETPPILNQACTFNYASATQYTGRNVNGHYADVYLAEVNYVDGMQLSPEHFGEFDDQDVWVPKQVNTSEWPFNSLEIAGATGTTGGNMTSNGGNAAAFDETTSQANAACAAGPTTGSYLQKQWSSAKVIEKVKVYASSDAGYYGSGTGVISIEGSATGAWAGEEVTLGTKTGVNFATNSLVTTIAGLSSDAYLYHRVTIDRDTGGVGTVYVAEVEFFELTPYGQNGFRLDFSDNSTANALGTDASGRGNNFTAFGILTTDQSSDTPTNVYCTLNPLDKGGSNVISYGNLKADQGGNGHHKNRGTFSVATGRYTFEGVVRTSANTAWLMALINPSTYIGGNTNIATQDGGLGLDGAGNVYLGATLQMNLGALAVNDRITFDFDIEANTLKIKKNGTWLNGGASVSTLPAGPLCPAINLTISQGITMAFSDEDMLYAEPSAKSICTANLPEPTIAKPSNYFDSVLYTGKGAVAQKIWKQDFQPDLVWIKRIDAISSSNVFDSMRGANSRLFADSNLADQAVTGALNSFDPQGFSLGTGSYGDVQAAGGDFVAWTWKKDPLAGFDIQTYTGTGTSGFTFTHNLGVKPEFMIIKNRDVGTTSWAVYHHKANLGVTPEQYFGLLGTSRQNAFTNVGGTAYWNDTAPTTTTVTLGNSANTNAANNFVAYLWAGVDGFSKFGNYGGNGSADGTFVNLGFKPAFIMIKRAGAAEEWEMLDTKRDIINPAVSVLQHNTAAEWTTAGHEVDILSNGFKLRSTHVGFNASGEQYLYVAFAADPFKKTTAR